MSMRAKNMSNEIVTAATITDEQIRELMDHAGKTPNIGASNLVFAICETALEPVSIGSERREKARARCAEILEARRTANTDRAQLNQAKTAAHEAYIAANRVLGLLDETADPTWITHAEAVREHAWQLYQDLVRETEW